MANYSKDAVLFGLVSAVAVGVTGYGVLWLRNSLSAGKENSFTVILPDARGLKGAEEVRIAGFKVGHVGRVGLTPDGHKAQIALLVETKYPIPKDSKIQVTPPLLGGSVFVSIVPGKSAVNLEPGQTVEGAAAAGLDELTSNANKIVGDEKTQEDLKATLHAVRITTESLNRLVNDPNIKRTLRGVGAASDQLPQTVAQTNATLREANQIMNQLAGTVNQLSRSANRVMNNVDSLTRSGAGAANEAEKTVVTFRSALQENRAQLKELVGASRDAMVGVSALTDRAGQLIGDPDLKSNLVKVTANLSDATKNLTAISEKLDKTAGNIEKLSGDETLTKDLKETLSNVKETSASFSRIAGRVEKLRLPGERRTGEPGPKREPQPPGVLSLIEPGLTFDTSYDTTNERFRLDTNYVLPSSDGRGFYRVGLQGATEGNKLNFQLGGFSRLPARADLRYGLFAGKLGAGVDARAGGLDFRLDALDPNRFTVNLRAKKKLDTNTALTAGIDSLGHGNRATVGIQIRR